MKKTAVFAELGNFYQPNVNGLDTLNFVYNNVDQLGTHLRSVGWETTLALKDEGATKVYIVQKLTEVINQSSDGDWLLFYFVGHGSKYPDALTIEQRTTYCVSYSSKLSLTFLPALSEFLAPADYQALVGVFEQKMPNGHLISIFDCCFADGILNAFDSDKPFQTVIAGSTAVAQSFYNDTSFLFKSLSQCWDQPFGQLQTQLSQTAQTQNLDLNCVVHAASNFLTRTLKFS